MGDRVGDKEHLDIERDYHIKQSVNKFGKNKNVRIGPRSLMSTLSKAAGAVTDGEVHEPEGVDWGWLKVFGGMLGFLQDIVKEMIMKK